jgi:hypothetical protein
LDTRKIPLIWVLMSCVTFLLKQIEDFCRFGVRLDCRQKSYKIVLIACASFSVALPHNIRSAANKSE